MSLFIFLAAARVITMVFPAKEPRCAYPGPLWQSVELRKFVSRLQQRCAANKQLELMCTFLTLVRSCGAARSRVPSPRGERAHFHFLAFLFFFFILWWLLFLLVKKKGVAIVILAPEKVAVVDLFSLSLSLSSKVGFSLKKYSNVYPSLIDEVFAWPCRVK